MGQTDASRVFVQEGAYPLRSFHLNSVIKEMTNCLYGIGFVKFIRADGLISRIEHYADPEKTELRAVQEIDRVSGSLGLQVISSVVTTIYEEDGITVDSMVSGFFERDLTVSGQDFITCCSGVFSTTESEKL